MLELPHRNKLSQVGSDDLEDTFMTKKEIFDEQIYELKATFIENLE